MYVCIRIRLQRENLGIGPVELTVVFIEVTFSITDHRYFKLQHCNTYFQGLIFVKPFPQSYSTTFTFFLRHMLHASEKLTVCKTFPLQFTWCNNLHFPFCQNVSEIHVLLPLIQKFLNLIRIQNLIHKLAELKSSNKTFKIKGRTEFFQTIICDSKQKYIETTLFLIFNVNCKLLNVIESQFSVNQ